MKNKAPLIARILLGLIFFVFGLNGFLNFITPPPMPEGAMNLIMAMVGSGYLMAFVKITEIICGLMFLAGFRVPLAVIMITPVVLNIFLFHAVLAPAGLGLPVIVLVLWAFLVNANRDRYRSIFSA